MQLKKFNETVRSIQSEPFYEDSVDPITYGIKRSVFDQQRYQKLIIEASKITDSRLAQNRLLKWKRLLERSRRSQVRFEKLRAEAQAVRKSFPLLSGPLHLEQYTQSPGKPAPAASLQTTR
jgi:hypothetical protein